MGGKLVMENSNEDGLPPWFCPTCNETVVKLWSFKQDRHVLWCSACQPPEIETFRSINLWKALRYVCEVVLDSPGPYTEGYNDLWEYLCQQGYIDNGFTTWIPFPGMLDSTAAELPNGPLSLGALEVLYALVETYDLRSDEMKDIRWEVQM